MLYAATDRRAMSPWLFPSHLNLKREQGAIGVDQQHEIMRILSQRPDVVVVAPRLRHDRADMRAVIFAGLARGYRKTAVVPLGTSDIAVYRRSD